jgi:CBS domain containing-hemolysin-like protein
VAVALAPPMRLFSRVFSPMINLLNGATRLVLRLFGLRGGDEDARVYTVEELRQIVRESEAGGVLDEDEREIIDAVFDIRGLLVRQVMVPRTEMHMVAAGARLDEIMRETIETPYTKFPVYDRDPDDIIGVLYVKDLVKALAHPKGEITAQSLATGTLFVPETMHVVRLMELFRKSGKHIAIVHDEFGGTEGMATLDDILGQLIGEVPDRFEYDQGEYHDIICDGDDFCVVDGLMLIEEFNELFGVRLHDENYNTIGGYVMGRLGRVPKVGDTVQAQGVRLSVEAMDALRIDQIGVYGRAPALEPDGS